MATASLDEETTKKVIRQVEFYFSDSNLPRDSFLSNTISESDDGLVSLALICSFSRMRTHLGLGDKKPEEISEDTVKAVAEALKNSNFLKVSEDGMKIGRATELPEPDAVIEHLNVRTIAASPLEYDVKLEDVESFFGLIAKVSCVRLPRHVADKRLFCGTALVEFAAEEDATRILTQNLVYGGVQLELKPKKDFDAERAKEEEEHNSRPQTGSNRKNSSNLEENYPKGLILAFTLKNMSNENSAKSNGSKAQAGDSVDAQKTDAEPDSMDATSEDADHKKSEEVEGNPGESIGEEADGKVDEKANLESEEAEDGKKSLESPIEDADHKKSEEVEGNPGESIGEEADGKVDEKANLESEEAEDGKKSLESPIENDKDESTAQKSTVDTYKDNKDVVLREDLKSVFQKFGSVKFIDFKIGDESGYIRFEDAEGSQKARAAAVLAEEGGLIVKNFVATLDPVTVGGYIRFEEAKGSQKARVAAVLAEEGEAEKEYWKQFCGNRDSKFRGGRGNWNRGGKHGGRGGRNFNGKNNRSRDHDSSYRSNKFQKVGAA